MGKNHILVPEARQQLNELKSRVMREKGYHVKNSEEVKYEVAKEQGISLTKGYNGQLTSEQAGKIGGSIGGNMVKEMIKMAQQQLSKK